MNEEELLRIQQENEELKTKLKMLEDIGSLKGQIDERKDIPFQSLTYSKLILQTGKLGDSEPEVFSEFGETKLIDYRESNEIVKRNRKFIQKGYVWIDDEDFIKKCHLDVIFENILSKEKLEELAKTDDRDFFEKNFASLPEGQKQAIVVMVHMQIKENKHDLRIVNSINNILGIDLLKDVERFNELMKPTEERVK